MAKFAACVRSLATLIHNNHHKHQKGITHSVVRGVSAASSGCLIMSRAAMCTRVQSVHAFMHAREEACECEGEGMDAYNTGPSTNPRTVVERRLDHVGDALGGQAHLLRLACRHAGAAQAQHGRDDLRVERGGGGRVPAQAVVRPSGREHPLGQRRGSCARVERERRGVRVFLNQYVHSSQNKYKGGDVYPPPSGPATLTCARSQTAVASEGVQAAAAVMMLCV